ncbi:MAG: hypothetical protein ABI692_04000, partial [Terracoccus sp.]
VLRCCERLMVEIERRPQPPKEVAGGEAAQADGQAGGEANDAVVIEGLWTLALLSYRRVFAPGALPGTGRLTVDDLKAVQPDAAATEWHDLLLRLRAHHAHERLDPREEFAVGAAQEEGGRVVGIAVTSRRQPPVDDVTVRQTGALAYSLRQLVGRRISESEAALLESVSSLPRDELDALAPLDIAPPSAASLN